MMQGMQGTGWMMGGMGLVWLLLLVLYQPARDLTRM